MKQLFFIFLVFISFHISAQIGIGLPYNRENNSEFTLDYQNPKEYEIADIQVDGAYFLDKNAIISLSGLSVGKRIKIPSEQISNAIKSLWKQGLLGNVSIVINKVEYDLVYLSIKITERPRLTKIIYEGISKSQIKEVEEKVKIIKGRILTEPILKNITVSIKAFFQEKGFYNTEVRLIQVIDTLLPNSVKLRAIIKKNNKIRVDNIFITGNTAFSDPKLKSKLKETGQKFRFTLVKDILSRFFNSFKPSEIKTFIDSTEKVTFKDAQNYFGEHVRLNIFKASKFQQDKYTEDKKKLIEFLNSKGYRDSEIIKDTIVINKKTVDIYLDLFIGNRYYFRNITWTGNYLYETKILQDVFNINKGDIYNLELVNKKLNYNPEGNDISSLYMDNGYLFFHINPVEILIENDSVDVEMRLYEGPQATIDKVYVTGNDRTRDHVVMREIRTLPGQKFSRADIIRTQRELSQLGYFDPEKITPTPIPKPSSETVDIEWKVVERPSDQLELSGGWGGSFGFIGTLGVTFNNFSLRNVPYFRNWNPLPVGDGQKLSIRFQANGIQFQSYSLSFTEPWFGGKKPHSFGMSFNYSAQNILSSNTSIIGGLGVIGASVNIGRRVKWPDDYFVLTNSFGYSRYILNNYMYIGQSLGFSTGTSNSITFNSTFSRNSVDNPLFPRSGSQLSLSVTLTPPYSLFQGDITKAEASIKYRFNEYHKWQFDSWNYLRVVQNLILVSRIHFGFIGRYTDKSPETPFERFTLGGDGLAGGGQFIIARDVIGLRGYKNNSITPSDIVNNINGGTIFNKFVFELRYPISLNPSATIYALTFLEAGNNFNVIRNYNPFNLYRSTGVGVRIFMPAFGLLGIDYGYGFDKLPGELKVSGSQFHFSIGTQIR
ncbi:MAG: BamA/TamA family outer membrane protein [Chitinophagaceae bacterium]|nr:BamA/TamA family outer membrane protein [Chitinophagaceae bacterium]